MSARESELGVILDPPLSLVPLGGPEERGTYEVESSVTELDAFVEQENICEEEIIVEEAPLGEPCEELVVVGLHPCLELVVCISPNPFWSPLLLVHNCPFPLDSSPLGQLILL